MPQPRQTYPITLSQRDLWFAETSMGFHATQFCCVARLQNASDIDGWAEAIRCVVRENDGLRLRMVLHDGDLRQYVSPDESVDVPFHDFRGTGGEEAYAEWIDREMQVRFALIDSPLYAFAILRRGSQDPYRLFIKIHHIIVDAWSMSLIIEQIVERYHALQRGKTPDAPPDDSFVRYILAQTAPPAPAKQKPYLPYFLEKFALTPAATRFQPGLPTSGVVASGRKVFAISPALRDKLSRFNEANHSSSYLFFLAGFCLYLSLLNDMEDAAVSTVFHNRLDPAYKNTIGLFATILPLRVTVSRDLTARGLVRRVLAEWKKSIHRQPRHLSARDMAMLYQRAKGRLDISFSYEGRLPDEPFDWLHWKKEMYRGSLEIHVLDHPSADWEIDFLYATRMYSEEDIDRHYRQLSQLWEALLASPDDSVSTLSAGFSWGCTSQTSVPET